MPESVRSIERECDHLRLDGATFDVAMGGLGLASAVCSAPATFRAIDEQNVESEFYFRHWKQQPWGWRRLARALDWWQVDRFERYWLKRANGITVCSARDGKTLAQLGLTAALKVIPNGVDVKTVPIREDCWRGRHRDDGAMSTHPTWTRLDSWSRTSARV